MAAVGTKQPNIVLCGLIVIGGLLVSLRDPNISLRGYLPASAGNHPARNAIYIAWRLHVETNQIEGEFNFLRREDWMLEKIDEIAGRMLTIASKKGGYFGIMLLACLFGARALWRIRSPFDRLSLIVAILFPDISPFCCWVRHRIRRIRLGRAIVLALQHAPWGACVAFGLYAAALLWRKFGAPRFRRGSVMLVITLLLLAPLALSHKIRFDLHPPTVFVRDVSEQGSRLSAAKFAYRSARRHRQRRVRSYCALCDVGQTELRGVFYRGESTDHSKPPKVRVDTAPEYM